MCLYYVPYTYNFIYFECAVPEKIHTHPEEGNWKLQGEGGGGGGGSQKPTFCMKQWPMYGLVNFLVRYLEVAPPPLPRLKVATFQTGVKGL